MVGLRVIVGEGRVPGSWSFFPGCFCSLVAAYVFIVHKASYCIEEVADNAVLGCDRRSHACNHFCDGVYFPFQVLNAVSAVASVQNPLLLDP